MSSSSSLYPVHAFPTFVPLPILANGVLQRRICCPHLLPGASSAALCLCSEVFPPPTPLSPPTTPVVLPPRPRRSLRFASLFFFFGCCCSTSPRFRFPAGGCFFPAAASCKAGKEEPEMGEAARTFGAVRQELVNSLIRNPSEQNAELLQRLVEAPLTPAEKYLQINVKGILRANVKEQFQVCLRLICTAFQILEKYGRNLLHPRKPYFWRMVKFNNPVFRDTVDTIQ
ncbi:uncharacterized protein LOC113431333, partial [Notechis scutatus]|uniref:Uncharacterized protein LOC113431333 n=1 Tax=Notechis scutatus TaxID=8663 RepID=A0A6J1W2S0_9SAUR